MRPYVLDLPLGAGGVAGRGQHHPVSARRLPSSRRTIRLEDVAGITLDSNGATLDDLRASKPSAGHRDVTLADNVVAQPDNATLNIGCAERGTGSSEPRTHPALREPHIPGPARARHRRRGKAKLDVVVRATRTASRASHRSRTT